MNGANPDPRVPKTLSEEGLQLVDPAIACGGERAVPKTDVFDVPNADSKPQHPFARLVRRRG